MAQRKAERGRGKELYMFRVLSRSAYTKQCPIKSRQQSLSYLSEAGGCHSVSCLRLSDSRLGSLLLLLLCLATRLCGLHVPQPTLITHKHRVQFIIDLKCVLWKRKMEKTRERKRERERERGGGRDEGEMRGRGLRRGRGQRNARRGCFACHTHLALPHLYICQSDQPL